MSKSITAKNAGNVRKFKPTPYMEKWLDTAIKLRTDSPTEISAVAEQRRENWYDWQKVDGFIEWYYAEYEKRLVHLRPKLDAIGLKFSEKGSYQHWKDMQKLAGRNLEPAQSHTTNIQIPVFNVMTNESKEQLSKLYEGLDSSND